MRYLMLRAIDVKDLIMCRKKGFTLIELLVVIAIIALLLAIIMPSLQKVQLQVKTLVCTVNCRSLSAAWATYASANDSMIVSSKTGFGGYYDHLMDPPYPTPHAWVDWAGYPDYDDPADKERQILTVERGALFPYVETIKAYRCPLSEKDQVRCYVIPDIIGYPIDFWAKHETLGDQEVVLKTTQIRMPSNRIVFLDEDDISYGGFTIWYQKPEWWDWPPSRHDNGLTLGYADGHAEYYKWRDQDTIDLAQGVTFNLNQPGNEDLIVIQRGVFGELGYIP